MKCEPNMNRLTPIPKNKYGNEYIKQCRHSNPILCILCFSILGGWNT